MTNPDAPNPDAHDSDGPNSNQDPESSLLPPDEDPPPPPPPPGVSISQVSPIAGGLAGGIDITLTGTGFQSGAEVFFGNVRSNQVTFISSTSVKAKLPAAAATGSVNVRIVNPNGTSATKTGGFTYVTTGTGQQAEVLGISPLAIIENTQTQLTVRGRNLIAARNQGLFALRGPSRAVVTLSSFSSSHDIGTGIDTIVFSARVTATPELLPLERLAIQVIASTRPESAGDGVVESSRQMFTVLPQTVPVPLAFTASIDPDKPSMVVVAGRNLAGCKLDLGENVTIDLQRGNDNCIAGVVTSVDPSAPPPQLSVIGPAGEQVNAFSVSIAPIAASSVIAPGVTQTSPGFAQMAAAQGLPLAPEEEGLSGEIPITLTPVPDQKIVGPTAKTASSSASASRRRR